MWNESEDGEGWRRERPGEQRDATREMLGRAKTEYITYVDVVPSQLLFITLVSY